MEQQERLHEANIKSLVADLETAYVENDQKKERLPELEEVVDVQRETLEIAQGPNNTAEKNYDTQLTLTTYPNHLPLILTTYQHILS